jgi:uroporphyrin-III C-methyltransferase
MGKVYLVGAGPGAPDLLTLRAARILAAADIVLHDALVHPDTLKLAAKARFIDVGKRYGKVSSEQRFIPRALTEAARAHDVVVRLKGGDPMMFGRAQEELDALAAAGIEAEVVPGITAALAAASTLKVSLTRRGRMVDPTPAATTDVFGVHLRGLSRLPKPSNLVTAGEQGEVPDRAALIGAGKPDLPVALAESATLESDAARTPACASRA